MWRRRTCPPLLPSLPHLLPLSLGPSPRLGKHDRRVKRHQIVSYSYLRRMAAAAADIRGHGKGGRPTIDNAKDMHRKPILICCSVNLHRHQGGCENAKALQLCPETFAVPVNFCVAFSAWISSSAEYLLLLCTPATRTLWHALDMSLGNLTAPPSVKMNSQMSL